MQFFQTDKDGFLVGPDVADESPLEPGVFLIPAGGVTLEPPALSANECARFVGGAWAIEPDYMGATYWMPDGTSGEIQVKGQPLPACATLTKPAPTLAKVQADKVAELSAACQAQIYAGFQSSALGVVHTYPAKDKDQVNLSGSVVASLLPGLPANWTTPFWCEDADGTWAFVPHTAAQIQQAGADGKAAIVIALEKNATLAAQVMAATTIADAQAIAW